MIANGVRCHSTPLTLFASHWEACGVCSGSLTKNNKTPARTLGGHPSATETWLAVRKTHEGRSRNDLLFGGVVQG